MDRETKLSPSQLASLLSLLKKTGQTDKTDVSSFLKDHLTPEQLTAAQGLLGDPTKLQTLLRAPQVQKLLKQLQKDRNDHDSGEL